MALGLAVHGELVGVAPAVPLRVEAHKAVKEVPGKYEEAPRGPGLNGLPSDGRLPWQWQNEVMGGLDSPSVRRNDRWIEQ